MNTDSMNYQAPSRLATLLEVRAPFDWASLVFRAPQLASAPRGDGRPVMLLPGYRADEGSLRPLSRYLEYLGYETHDWGLGRNRGDVENDVVRVALRCSQICEARDGQPVTLIGWSLGGVVARETARLHEREIREVITMGTPIVGGPKYTTVAARFAEIADLDLDKFEEEVHQRNLLGIRQPVTSIYSKSDGVVDWRASVDTYNPQALNLEVRSTHFGMGGNASIWLLIAEILAGSH